MVVTYPDAAVPNPARILAIPQRIDAITFTRALQTLLCTLQAMQGLLLAKAALAVKTSTTNTPAPNAA